LSESGNKFSSSSSSSSQDLESPLPEAQITIIQEETPMRLSEKLQYLAEKFPATLAAAGIAESDLRTMAAADPRAATLNKALAVKVQSAPTKIWLGGRPRRVRFTF
jgi:D-serine dehydratase